MLKILRRLLQAYRFVGVYRFSHSAEIDNGRQQYALEKRTGVKPDGRPRLGHPFYFITDDPDVLALLDRNKLYRITIEEIK